MKHLTDKSVNDAFTSFPEGPRQIAEDLHALIIETANDLGLSEITESLKWGQPSFAAPKGTPLRIGMHKSGHVALFAHCQSRVISEFAKLGSDRFEIEGTRAVILPSGSHPPLEELRPMIAHALTYKT